MSRVAVLFPPLELSRDFIDYPWFADLGAIQAAALLAEAGHQVEILDALAHPGSDVARLPDGRARLGVTPDLGGLRDPDLIVVAFTPFQRPPRRDPLLGRLLRDCSDRWHGRPIVLADLYQGGQHFIEADPLEILREYSEVDVLLRYEAEATLPELVAALLREKSGAKRVVHGIEPADLDALPLPAWDRVDVEAYFRLHERVMSEMGRPRWAFPIDRRSLPLMTSRGCPFRCLHCSSNPGLAPGRPKRQRRKSRTRMGRELAWLESLGTRRVHVLDEMSNVNPSHFDDLLELVAEKNLAIEIPNGLRADLLADGQLALLAGRMTTLSVSAESGVQRVVSEVVAKELDLKEVARVAERARAYQLPLLVHFMLGLPGETREEINGTLAFAADLWERFGSEPSLQFATPLPGTALSRALGSLPVVEDWGPRFQQQPTPAEDGPSADELLGFERALEDRVASSKTPKRAVLQVTFECNNRCAFCMTGTRAQLRRELSHLSTLLARARSEGARELRLDGGEPTLHPELFALIREARRLGFEQIDLTTNGRRAYYPEYARRLAGSGLSRIAISIQGADALSHGREVGVEEAFDQTITGARNLVAAVASTPSPPDAFSEKTAVGAPPDASEKTAVGGRPGASAKATVGARAVELWAKTTLTRGNVAQLAGIAGLAHEIGLRRLEIGMTLPFGSSTSEIAPDPEVAAEAVMRLIDRWKHRLAIQVSNLPWCLVPGYAQHLRPDELWASGRTMWLGRDARVNDYWRSQREHRPQCATCVRRVCCGGFFRTEGIVEPDWLPEPTASS